MIVLKNDDNIHFELDLETARRKRGTGEESRKNHIDRYGHATTDVPIADLYVLYLGRIPRISLGAAARLDANELEFNRLDGHRRFFNNQLASKGLGDETGGRVEMTGDEKLRQSRLLLRLIQRLGRYFEIDSLLIARFHRRRRIGFVFDEKFLLLVEIAREKRSFHVASDRVLDVDEDAVIRFVERLALFRLERKFEGDLRLAARYLAGFGEIHAVFE